MTKIGIICDASSLWFTAKKWREARVDYAKLRRVLADGRTIAHCFVYIHEREGMDSFEYAMSRIGYDVKMVRRPKRMDVIIDADIRGFLDDCDTVVIATGDGDYGDLIRHIQLQGKRVELHAFPIDSPIRELLALADCSMDLGEEVLEARCVG